MGSHDETLDRIASELLLDRTASKLFGQPPPNSLLTKLAHPDDGKPHDLEHSGAKVVRLATELLAELTHLREYGLMAADDVATATAGVRALLDSGAADEIDVEQIISGLVVWCDNLLSKWEGEWHRTGRDECAEGGENPPMYFRGT